MSREPGPGRRLRAGFLAFFFLVTAALTWPGVWLANREDPFVLGLPFFLFWVILWVVLSLGGQVLLYLSDPSNREPEEDA